jgi:hypothetical protein
MDNTNSNSNENVLPIIKSSKVFYVTLGIIVFLVVGLFLIYFKLNFSLKKGKSDQEVRNNVLITFFFCLIVLCLCGFLLPNIKDLKNLFSQISNVTYVILYTIGLILFFGFMSPSIINDYAYIILPIAAIVGTFVFYKSASYSYVDEFNINYERIKSVILFLCLITIFIIFYNADPGGYISKYFGFSLLLAILIGVFGLLYLIIVMTLPDNPEKSSANASTNSSANSSANLLNKFSSFSNYIGIGYIIFLFIFGIMAYMSYSKESGESFAAFFVIGIIVSILWGILLVTNSFPEIIDKSVSSTNLNIFQRSLLILFAVVISGLFISWIATTIQDYSGQSNIAYLILNVAIIIIVLGLLYRIISVPLPIGNNKKNAFINLIVSILFYIPCFFNGIFDSAGKLFSGNYSGEAGSLLMLFCVLGLFVLYFRMPSVFNLINTQGGKQLVNKPVNTNSEYALGTYQELNDSEQYDYQYGISFWVFIHAAPPNMNENYNTFTSLLNFGGKPNVLYNASTNTIMVTIKQDEDKQTESTNKKNSFKLTDYDENGNRILYKNDNFLLQKWNNFIINYNGGVLDIFLNGELMKSNIGVVPYYKLDNLTIGHENGIEGGICNVVYFNKPLTTTNIYYLYNMVKNRTPPVLNDSNKTILVKNINDLSSSV